MVSLFVLAIGFIWELTGLYNGLNRLAKYARQKGFVLNFRKVMVKDLHVYKNLSGLVSL